MNRELVIQAAQAEIGNHNPVKYWQDVWIVGGPHPEHWCGGFALWCLHQGGIALDINWEFDPPHYGFLYKLPKVETPLVGDIAYFDKPYQHHAVVESFDGVTLWTIDGNSTLGRDDPLPPRVLSHQRVFIDSKVDFYSIARWTT